MQADRLEIDDPRYHAAQRFQDSISSGMAYGEGPGSYYYFSAHEMDAFAINGPSAHPEFDRDNFARAARSEQAARNELHKSQGQSSSPAEPGSGM